MRVKLGEVALIVGSVYFKPGLDFQTVLELFQAVIDDVLANSTDEVVIIGGDFNARVGNPEPLPIEIFEETCLEYNVVNSDETVNP